MTYTKKKKALKNKSRSRPIHRHKLLTSSCHRTASPPGLAGPALGIHCQAQVAKPKGGLLFLERWTIWLTNETRIFSWFKNHVRTVSMNHIGVIESWIILVWFKIHLWSILGFDWIIYQSYWFDWIIGLIDNFYNINNGCGYIYQIFIIYNVSYCFCIMDGLMLITIPPQRRMLTICIHKCRDVMLHPASSHKQAMKANSSHHVNSIADTPSIWIYLEDPCFCEGRRTYIWLKGMVSSSRVHLRLSGSNGDDHPPKTRRSHHGDWRRTQKFKTWSSKILRFRYQNPRGLHDISQSTGWSLPP